MLVMVAHLMLGVDAAPPTAFWMCQVGGTSALCPNISRAAPAIDNGGSNQIFTTYYGRMPILNFPPRTTAGKPSWCNGGVPQLANLSLHSARMSQHLDSLLPVNYTGLIVIDYESWWPTWNTSSELYHNASRAVARSQLPANASESMIEAKAKADFDTASIDFFTFTTTETKRLRPHARVGFYAGTTTGSAYWSYSAERDHAIHTAQLKWWAAVDVLMPSLYLPYNSASVPGVTPANLTTYVQRLQNSSRDINALLEAHGIQPKPIVPYTWYRYHDGSSPGALALLSDQDADIEFFQLLRGMASQVMIWGNEAIGPNAFDTVDFFTRHAGQFGQFGRDGDSDAMRVSAAASSPAALGVIEDAAERARADRQAMRITPGAASSPSPPIDPHAVVPPWQECSL